MNGFQLWEWDIMFAKAFKRYFGVEELYQYTGIGVVFIRIFFLSLLPLMIFFIICFPVLFVFSLIDMILSHVTTKIMPLSLMVGELVNGWHNQRKGGRLERSVKCCSSTLGMKYKNGEEKFFQALN